MMKAFSELLKEVGTLGVTIFSILGLAIAFAVVYNQNPQLFQTVNINLTTETSGGTYYKVTKVIDGDTLYLEMGNVEEKIRLIGINTPETVDPRIDAECFGKEAKNRMEDIAEGKLVRLEYDETQGLRDVYNRILAYAYLEDGQMLNRKMIAEGYAYEYTYLTPYMHQKEFRELQTLARTSSRGLWSADTCNGSKRIVN